MLLKVKLIISPLITVIELLAPVNVSKSSLLKPLCRLKPYFLNSLPWLGEWKFVQIILVAYHNYRTAHVWWNNFEIFISRSEKPLTLKFDMYDQKLESYKVLQNDDSRLALI